MQAARPRSGAESTTAIYMDSDNYLEPWAQEDISEMMMVGSRNAVNIVVMWDRYAGPTNIYQVQRNELRELTDPAVN